MFFYWLKLLAILSFFPIFCFYSFFLSGLAGVFELIGRKPLSPGLALPTFFSIIINLNIIIQIDISWCWWQCSVYLQRINLKSQAERRG